MFPFSKPKSSLVLLLDVQSSIVRGTLVHFQNRVKPEMVFSYITEIPFKLETDSGYLAKMTVNAVNDTLEAVLKEISLRKSSGVQINFSNKISAVHYILSSPWIVSQAKTLSLSLHKKEKISREKIRSIVAEERKKLTDDDEARISVIEEKVFDVRLNGYSVTNWEGLYSDNLEISFVVSVAGKNMIENFKKVSSKIVSEDKVHFHSSLLLQNIGIQKIMPERSDYSLIHAHGELTDVVIIKDHSCIFFGSFPMGIRSIIRKIAEINKTDEHTAESLLTLYMNNSLDQSHTDDVTKVLNDISATWIKELEELLVKFGASSSLPNETIISARSHDQYFMQIFKSARPNSRIDILSLEDIKPYINFNKESEYLRILGLCTVAINSTGNE